MFLLFHSTCGIGSLEKVENARTKDFIAVNMEKV